MFFFQDSLFLRSGQDADSQRFGQKQLTTCRGCIVFLHFIDLHNACNGKAEQRFLVIDTVSAGQGDPGILAHLPAAVEYLLRNI